MKVYGLTILASRRHLAWAAVAAALYLVPVVYTLLDSSWRAEAGVPRVLSASERADRARTWEDLGTMEKLDEMVASGLFDPENEYSPKVGEPAPDFELMPLRFYDFAIDRGITKSNAGTLYDPIALSEFREKLPVVLIFGNYSYPAFKDQAGFLNDMARKYKGRAQFFVIYIEESYASSGRMSRLDSNSVFLNPPETFLDRVLVANTCLSELGIDIPCLVDDMENTATRAYKGWPSRMCIVACNGDLAYVGQPGSSGFLPGVMEAAFVEALAREGP